MSGIERPTTPRRKPAKSVRGKASASARVRRARGLGATPPPKRRLIWRLFYWLAVLIVWGTLALGVLAVYYAYDLPDISDLKPTVYRPSITVVASDGTTIANYGDVYGEWLNYNDLPPVLVQAVLATEDRRFFDHGGIDFRGLARAMVQNVRAGRVVQGGSTITQQLAKNIFLSSDRTVRRKVQELVLALWIEAKLSKEEILSTYLNRVYFGSRSYGVDAASRTYFGHTARKLELAEAAMLAGLLKAPSAYAPTRNYEKALRRSHEVLDNMVEASYMPQARIDSAKKQRPNLLDRNATTDARYFTDWVVEQLPEEISQRQEPLIIYTTFDLKTQAAAEQAFRERLAREAPDRNIGEAALVAMGPDGSVRAMLGGRNYAKTQYNRVTHARRQPGSAFKLFVYMAALDAGMMPDDIMRDSPVIIDGWQPENYNGAYQGNMSLEQAFAQSVNTIAVKVSETVNRRRVIKVAEAMGIKSPIVPHPSVALGTSELSLLEMTGAYAVVANGGYRASPYAIVEIRSGRGETLFTRVPPDQVALIDGKANDLMDNMLRTAVMSGTAKAARLPWRTVGKTGTSQDHRDALFIGYGTDEQGRILVSGVWIGNDNGSPMKNVTGGSTPARVWHDFMAEAHKGGGYVKPMPRPKMDVIQPEEAPKKDGLFERIRKKLFGD